MCGIAGIVNFDGQSVHSKVIADMLSCINYRGPDERGIYVNSNVGMGNVRLSIIDISGGQQPMCNNDKSLWIVYNGEVFNYIELRDDLIKKGVTFKTCSDTEVVLRYYEKYKEKCLDYFNGQFAFAIWDNIKKEIFLARDRVGIRPLYYYFIKDRLIFGSEIKTILFHPDVIAELDYEGLSEVYTYWANITPKTCFKNIQEISPGHYIIINKNSFVYKKYWQFQFDTEYNYGLKDVEMAARELKDILMDAVKLRLRADVPVAAYLSGGLDSSIITCLAKNIIGEKLQTFSISFREQEFDESHFQDECSSFLNTKHTKFICNNSDIGNHFRQVIWHTEFPILRTAPVPMFLLSKNVRQGNIKVILTGEGADEILGGYNIFKEMKIRRFWAKYPDSKIRPILLKRLYPYINNLQQQDFRKLKFFFGYKLTDLHSPVYSHFLRWNNSSNIISYLSREHKVFFDGTELFKKAEDILPNNFHLWHSLSKAQWIEANIFMSGYLLSSQGDRMSMANSVEGRYPFLDHRVIDFCNKLHPDLKLNALNEKYILKKAMAGQIPQSIINRSKQAYRAPIRKAFFNEQLPDLENTILGCSAITEAGIFQFERVQQLLSRIKSGLQSELDDMALAAILSTQYLYDLFVVNFPKTKKNSEQKILITS